MEQHLELVEQFGSDPQRHISQWVNQVLGVNFHKYRRPEAWTPAINVYEDDVHWCVYADLAGMDADEIDLRSEGGRLVLEGTRPAPMHGEPSGPVHLHLMEIDDGRFRREIELPPNVDVENIEAHYKCGMLWVRLPKKG